MSWFVLAFALFTAMLTKFHHYIFPAVPPAAMLTGVLLDRALGRGPLAPGRVLALGAAGALLAVTLAQLGPGRLDGLIDGTLSPPNVGAAMTLGTAAALLAWWGARGVMASGADGLSARTDSHAARTADPGSRTEKPAARTEKLAARTSDPPARTSDSPARTSDEGSETTDDALLLGALLVGGVAVLILVGRDLAARPANEVVGDARLLHLFTYNYRRLWPETLSFGTALVATAAASSLLTLALGGRQVRRAAAVALTGLGLTFSAWSLDVYFVKTAPHWGQREVIEAYYVTRRSAAEPIVGYQMNWKGENFYTGNHLNAFVSSGDRFKTWVKEQRAVGTQTMFVVVEQNRVGNLRRELDASAQLETLIDRATNNKFTLVRVRWPDRVPGGTMTPQVP